MFFDILLRRSSVGFFPASATHRARRWTVSLALAVVCCFASSGGAHAHTITWSRVGTVTTLTNGQLCTNDGWNVYCDSTTPTIASGLVGIGSTAPVVSLDLSQKTDALALPVGTSGMRPTGANLANGELRYNSTLSGVETYVNGTWDTVLTAASLGSSLPAAGSTGQVQFNNGGDLGASANFFWDNTNGRVGIGTASPLAHMHLAGGSSSQSAWGTNGVGLREDAATYTDTSSSGAVSGTVAINSIAAPTLTATSASTYAQAATLYIAGPPTAGSNVTITSNNGLYVNGSAGFAGTVSAANLSVPSGNASTTSVTVTANSTASANMVSFTSNSTSGTASASDTLLNIARSGANTNSSHTAYGLQSSVTDTGTNSTDIGGLFSASGGTNNYGLLVTNGNVGIGTTSPGSSLQVNGGEAVGYSTSTAAPTNGLTVSGNVGVGTATVPTGVTANINGPVKVAGTGSEGCSAATVGTMRYNPTGQYMEICTFP